MQRLLKKHISGLSIPYVAFTFCYLPNGRYASIFINERNRSIKADVIKNYSSLASQHELKVFCVSNRYYEGAAFDTNIAKDIARSVSGIRELRQFCHTVVAEAQYYAAIHYIDVKCLGLLRQLELWTQATSTKKREQVIQRNSVKELQNVSNTQAISCVIG